jgi:glycerophosphoryl diester phosphodiesterase
VSDVFRRRHGRPLVIAHRGASAVAPENTLAALEAAVAARADVIEIDVSPGLVVAHSLRELPTDPLDLDAALAYIREHDVGVHLDVKLPGYEREVADAVRRHELGERAYVSTARPAVTRAFARVAPELPRAIGYPRDRVGAASLPWPHALSRAGAASLRAVMPVRLPLLLRQARAGALALHHTLCSAAALEAAHRIGAPVLVWTVDDPAEIRRFAALGVDGIVSDDPAKSLATLAAL